MSKLLSKHSQHLSSLTVTNDEILKLAKECGIRIHKYNDDHMHTVSNNLIEAFYRAAYNRGIEDAAKEAKQLLSHWTNISCYRQFTFIK